MTGSRPLVSIVVPVYNTEPYLRECLDSLVNQTIADIEIIVVDDGSPDSSPAIMDDYANRDPRIKVVRQENGGLPAARNAGIAIARGRYVGFVDSDDSVTPTMFHTLVHAAEQSGADVTMCDYARVSSEGISPKTSGIREGTYDRAQIVREILPTIIMDDRLDGPHVLSVWRCLYRREFLAANGISFDARAKYSEDYLFSLAVMLRARSFVYVKNRHEYLYRHNAESISQTVKQDSWQRYLYLNQAMAAEVAANHDGPHGAGLERQLRLHMLYLALYTSNLVKSSHMPLREKRRMLREIMDSERLQDALSELDLPRYPALTRATIACIKRRSPIALLALDAAATRMRRLR